MTTAQKNPSTAPVVAPQEHQPFSVRKKFRSVFLTALVLFGIFNTVSAFFNPFKFDPYKYSYRGWTWWMVEDLRHTTDIHNIAVLGSSLIVSATAACDANHLNRKLDLTKYHRNAYLEDGLTANFGGKFSSFNLSAPGQMPSDAYLALKTMTSTANRPDIVIYGVAPRDFIDSTLSSPADTEPFKYLTRLVNIDEVANAEFRSLWTKLDWCLQRLVFCYRYSLDYRLALAESAGTAINTVIPCPKTKTPFTWWDRVRMMPLYLPAEIHPEAMISSPSTKSSISFTDNTQDYKARYKSPDSKTFGTQMYFLRKLSEYCHRERMELVVVNMPITEENIALLPPGTYDKYLASLREFAWNHAIIYYDLCDRKSYQKEDFHDTVHLNAFGGKKFYDALLASLKKDDRATTLLKLSGVQLEQHKALANLKRTRTY